MKHAPIEAAPVVNGLSVDVEDWFQVGAFENAIGLGTIGRDAGIEVRQIEQHEAGERIVRHRIHPVSPRHVEPVEQVAGQFRSPDRRLGLGRDRPADTGLGDVASHERVEDGGLPAARDPGERHHRVQRRQGRPFVRAVGRDFHLATDVVGNPIGAHSGRVTE